MFADFNHDGRTDLVVASGDSVWLFLGSGGGRFLPPRVVGPFGPYDAGDLNGDGNPDLVLGGFLTRVLFGVGDGTFRESSAGRAGQRLQIAGPSCSTRRCRDTAIDRASQTVHIADLHGDGMPDLILRTKVSLLVYLSNGNGSFQVPVETALSAGTYSSMIGDFNGDGVPDVLLPPASLQTPYDGVQDPSASTRFEVLLGRGDGTFSRRATSLSHAGDPLGAVLVGDFNGDKISDVVFGGTTLALGSGDGGFRPAVTLPYGFPTAAADLNGDGILDLFIHQPYDTYYGGTTAVMFGNGDGTFTDPKPISAARSVGNGEMAILGAADLNGAGSTDLVAGWWWKTSWHVFIGSDGLWALLNNGSGTFSSAQKIGGARLFGGIQTADFNGDGKRDMAVGDFGGGVIHLYLGQGGGSFDPVVDYDVGAAPGALASQDFNGDGIDDLAILLSTHSPFKSSIPLLFGGPGGFLPEQGRLDFPEPIYVTVLRPADFNGDLRPDLAGASPELWVGLGNGEGSFRQVRHPLENPPLIEPELQIARLDGDAKDDILGVGPGGQNAQELLVLLSNGDGTFRRSPSYSFNGGIYGIAAADFTGRRSCRCGGDELFWHVLSAWPRRRHLRFSRGLRFASQPAGPAAGHRLRGFQRRRQARPADVRRFVLFGPPWQ